MIAENLLLIVKIKKSLCGEKNDVLRVLRSRYLINDVNSACKVCMKVQPDKHIHKQCKGSSIKDVKRYGEGERLRITRKKIKRLTLMNPGTIFF